MKPRAKKIFGAGAFVIVLMVGLMGSVSRQISFPLVDGGSVRVKPASFWGKLMSGKCAVEYRSKKGVSGTIALNDVLVSGPWLIVPLDNRTIYCLYDLVDEGLLLFRIDAGQDFKALQANEPLSEMVTSSPWKVSLGRHDDWEKLYGILKDMPSQELNRIAIPGLDFGVWRVHGDPEKLRLQVRDHLSVY